MSAKAVVLNASAWGRTLLPTPSGKVICTIIITPAQVAGSAEPRSGKTPSLKILPACQSKVWFMG